AGFLAGQRDCALAALCCFLEGQRYRVVQIDPALGCASLSRVALMEDVGEQIAKSRRLGAADAHRKVESLEPNARVVFVALGGLSRRVVAAATLGIDERRVGLRN